MKHVVVHRPGGHEQLSLEDAADPRVGEGEVQVEVEASGINYADVMVRMGLYESAKKYVGWPIVPGFEVAGTAGGRPVIAVTRFGGYADRIVVPAWQVLDRPQGLDAPTAAGLPVVFMTAWFAVHELANVRPGRRALVHSAAGGVGQALVQLLRRAGCEVTGIVRGAHKVDVVRALGAEVVDKATQPLPEGSWHYIFDANGVETLPWSFDHLAAPGKLVVYGFHTMLDRGAQRPRWPKLAWRWLRTPRFSPLQMTGSNRSVLGFNLSYLFEERALFEEAMGDVLAGLAAGELTPLPTRSFPAARVAEAHGALESGDSVGKLVLTW